MFWRKKDPTSAWKRDLREGKNGFKEASKEIKTGLP